MCGGVFRSTNKRKYYTLQHRARSVLLPPEVPQKAADGTSQLLLFYLSIYAFELHMDASWLMKRKQTKGCLQGFFLRNWRLSSLAEHSQMLFIQTQNVLVNVYQLCGFAVYLLYFSSPS